MDYYKTFHYWKTNNFFDKAIRDELSALDPVADAKEIEDRFYQDIEFGTGGLRGVMGAGTNRINKYTVGKATKGLADYLLKIYGRDVCRNRGVVIGYDTRNNSKYFSEIAANVLSSAGIRVYLHTDARPTPQLSFSVKFYNALAGVVVTASHNAKEYNGYKIYDEFGCQLVPAQAKQVKDFVNAVVDYEIIDFRGNRSLIQMVDVTDCMVDAVLKQSRNSDMTAKEELHIIYTPLYGTGNIPVTKALLLDGFKVEYVEEQAMPNGNFPTVASPNPEDRRSLLLGIEHAERTGADIVLGTDPDCDRVGVAVKTMNIKNGTLEYQLITGNQMGALLTDYVLSHTNLCKIKNPAIVKTVVSSELGADIAKKHGVAVFSTLTGFKYIGEKITQFEKSRMSGGNRAQDYTFILGYEESYGYLIGTHARDKDAIVASMLICEMAAEYKAQGKTLIDRMNEIYEEYGFYRDALDSFTLKGKDGLDKISSMMGELRSGGSPFEDTEVIIDYSCPVEAEKGFGTLPTSNVLKYVLTDGSWLAIRPSGTEPKIKIYYSIKGASKDSAEKKLKRTQDMIQMRLDLG
mgnify:CR=1 FL=1